MLRTLSLAFALALAAAATVDAGPPADPPTDQAIIDLCGGRLKKVFDRFGAPLDLYISPGNDFKDAVALDYGSFAFRVHDKTVRDCNFHQSWKGTVKGVKIGDGRDVVVKAFGEKVYSPKNSSGGEDYGYEFKEADAIIWFLFDKDDKVRFVQIVLK